jgi:hypothetical protein
MRIHFRSDITKYRVSFFSHSRVDCTRIGIDLHGKRTQKSPPMKEREREREIYTTCVAVVGIVP